MTRTLPALLTALLLCTTHAQAQAQPSRPKIGLALGGGGARGGAHIGVLRVLEELRIPVDYIAGTSMGAVVGGLYASGMTVDEIEHELTTIDWADALTDRTRYKDLSFRRKEDENRYLTTLEAGLKRGRLVLPSGLRSGQKLRFILQSYLIPVAAVRDFSKLPIPFRAVAGDIETGQAVILDHGDLAEAIRASMSLPGAFSPIEIDGKLLIDGGVAMNVPVDVVRAMGADIVIAVDVGSPLMKRDQLGSLVAVANQVLTMLTRNNAQEQLTRADVVLDPPVGSFGTLAFESARTIVGIGTEYTRQQRDRLLPFSVDEAVYADSVATRVQRDTTSPPLDYLGTEGSRRVDNRIIKANMRTRPGIPLDGERLRRDVTRLYGLDDFQTVTFSIQDEGGQHGLVLNLKDKPWGPTYVRFGINLSDDLKSESNYSIVANVTRTRINALGAEWRNDLRFGTNLGVASEFYQPLDFTGRFFVAPSYEYSRNIFSVYEDRRRTAVFDFDQQVFALDLGMQFEDWGEFRTGVFRGRVDAGLSAGEVDLPDGSLDLGGMRSSLTIVRTDSPTIPHEGATLEIQYLDSLTSLGGADPYTKLTGNAFFVFTLGKQTYLISGGAGTNFGTDLPGYDEFSLGGFLSLGAFATGQLHGQRAAVVRLGTYRRMRTLPANIGGGVYGGVIVEAGNAWPDEESVSIDDIHRSVTLILGADTIVGPVFLGYARAETSDSRFYVTIGKTF